jgi:hypothetical protein
MYSIYQLYVYYLRTIMYSIKFSKFIQLSVNNILQKYQIKITSILTEALTNCLYETEEYVIVIPQFSELNG